MLPEERPSHLHQSPESMRRQSLARRHVQRYG